jgi:hypothetical protein
LPEFEPYNVGDIVSIYWHRERKDKRWLGVVEPDGRIRILSKREAREIRRNQVESERMTRQSEEQSEDVATEEKGQGDPERFSEAYDPPPGRRIGGQRYDIDDVPTRDEL